MPTLEHEGLLHLFEHRPALAAELARDCLGLALPEFCEAHLVETAFSQLVPPARLADRVVLLRANEPCFAIVVEVQLACDGARHHVPRRRARRRRGRPRRHDRRRRPRRCAGQGLQ